MTAMTKVLNGRTKGQRKGQRLPPKNGPQVKCQLRGKRTGCNSYQVASLVLKSIPIECEIHYGLEKMLTNWCEVKS